MSTSCPRFSGLYKSENEGATWAKVNVGLPDDATVNGVVIFGTNGASTAGVRVSV